MHPPVSVPYAVVDILSKCERFVSIKLKSTIMKKKALNIKELQSAAKKFCEKESGLYRSELFGVTDGKAVGTFVEHLFQEYLEQQYEMTVGSSANGLDLPSVNTDIKVTSIKQPQSSCPFKDSKQKIYGLGYNLIVFVYKRLMTPKPKVGVLISFLVHSLNHPERQTTKRRREFSISLPITVMPMIFLLFL